jgi:hypothetical protein
MLEGEAWVPKRVEEVLPLEKLGGLRRVRVEVRYSGREGDCARAECWNCEGGGRMGVCEKERALKRWFEEEREGVSVEFVRVAA